jgi:hypothetical protein
MPEAAPTVAPVVTSPAAAPAPAPEGPVRQPAKTKSYTTRGVAAATPAVPKSPVPTPQAAAAPSPDPAPPGDGAKSAVASEAGTDPPKSLLTADLPPEEPPAAVPSTDKPTVDEFEIAKRLGALTRRERKMAEDAQRNSSRLELADVVIKHLGPGSATPKEVQSRLQAFEMVDKGRELAARDPIGFLGKVFGVSPDVIVRAAVDTAIKDRARKPEEIASEREAARDRKIAELEEQIRTGAKETEQQRSTRQVNDYIEATIAPVIADTSKYPFIHRLCKANGADPKKELYNAMSERYAKTGKAPSDVGAFASELERKIKSHFVPESLPAPNANRGQPATPARVETPPASAVSRRATVADSPSGIRQKQFAKPYVSRPKTAG